MRREHEERDCKLSQRIAAAIEKPVADTQNGKVGSDGCKEQKDGEKERGDHARSFAPIHRPIPIMNRFSVSETKPSGTLLPPPTQAHLSSRLSM